MIAIVFHLIGLTGILFFDRDFFIRATPLNLLLMFALVLYTQPGPRLPLYYLIVVCAITGFLAELIGVSTGWLFGAYAYGDALGPKLLNVPLIIGINWFIIVYCCGTSVHMLMEKLVVKLTADQAPKPALKALWLVLDASLLAMFFDWLMEPVAVRLDYWHWIGTFDVPLYNYLSWFMVSFAMLAVFEWLPFPKKNIFAVNLLLIQAMFFLLLRTFL